MNLKGLAKIFLEAGLSVEEVRHELRVANCQPTCGAVEEAIGQALAECEQGDRHA